MGGTFDPIHNAHLAIAEAAIQQCRLDRVLLIPAAHPPHRGTGAFAGYEDRYRMVEAACAGHPKLVPSRLEEEHPQEQARKSYSIETVERFLNETPAPAELYFVIGADAFAEITTWFRWKDLAGLVTFAVVGRPGARYDVPGETRVEPVDGVKLPISSSGIRAELAAGAEPADLPRGVLDYIRARHLYGAHDAAD